MGKNPATQLYWNDLTRDLKPLSLEAKGAWVEILGHLNYSRTKGMDTLDLLGWSGIIGGGATIDRTKDILYEIWVKNVADMRVLISSDYVVDNPNDKLLKRSNNQNPDMEIMIFQIPCNALVTVINRRMIREEKARQDNAKRVRKYRKKF